MATKNPSRKNQVPAPRGFAIPVASRGTDSATFEMSRVPAPSRYFAADGFAIKQQFGQMQMAFFQRRFDGKAIRAMLDLRMSFHAFKGLAGLVDFGDADQRLITQFLVDGDIEEPEQTLAYEVSMCKVHANSLASNIDFYYVAGWSANSMQEMGEVHAEDVVSIQLPNFMLRPLFSVIKNLSNNITIVKENDGQ